MAGSGQGAKFDVVLKLGLVFFVSLLSFAVGTYVGKKFSDNQHKLSKYESGSSDKVAASDESDDHDDALAAKDEADGHGAVAADDHGDGHTPAKKSREVASIPPKGGEMKPKDALSDDEIAKLAQEFIADKKTDKKGDKKADKKIDVKAETKSADKHGAKPESHAKATAGGSVHDTHSAKEIVAKTPKPDSHLKPKQIPTELPKELAASPSGKFTVQIASTQNENDAQKMASGLKDKGHSAFYVPAKIKDKTWYRVSVGLFSTQSEADEFKRKLDKDGISKTIVQKITN